MTEIEKQKSSRSMLHHGKHIESGTGAPGKLQNKAKFFQTAGSGNDFLSRKSSNTDRKSPALLNHPSSVENIGFYMNKKKPNLFELFERTVAEKYELNP